MKQSTLSIFARLLATAGLMAALPALAGHQVAVNPIAVKQTRTLSFGKFAAGNGGSVVMSPSGTRSAAGSVILVSSDRGAAGAMEASGDPLLTYTITLPADGVVSLANAGGQSMAVDKFTSNPVTSGTLSGTGVQTVNIGATLSVAPGQITGQYNGSYSLVVNYD